MTKEPSTTPPVAPKRRWPQFLLIVGLVAFCLFALSLGGLALWLRKSGTVITVSQNGGNQPASKAAALPDYSQASTVSIEFGVTNREQGLYVLDVGDSEHTPVTRDGEEAWFFARGVNYCYLHVDPTFKETLSNAVVRVEYQVVRGNPIGLHYDGLRGTYSSPNYSEDKGRTGQWRVIEFALHDTLFRNAQNGGADFRLQDNGSGFYLHRVTVSHYQRGRIPSRPASTSSNQLDLSTNYNSGIRYYLPTPDLAAVTDIQQRIRDATTIDFDARGVVLAAKGGSKTSNIPVNRRVGQIHFLQAALSTEPDGTQIGSYIIHFANGSSWELPLIYGGNIRALNRDYRPTPNAQVVVWLQKKRRSKFFSVNSWSFKLRAGVGIPC